MQKANQVVISDPEIQGGTPCFAGTRVPVRSLFDSLARDRTLSYFLDQFPSVGKDQAEFVLLMAGLEFDRKAMGAENEVALG